MKKSPEFVRVRGIGLFERLILTTAECDVTVFGQNIIVFGIVFVFHTYLQLFNTSVITDMEVHLLRAFIFGE